MKILKEQYVFIAIYNRRQYGMAKIELSENQKKLDIDLWIIMIVSFASLMIFMVFQEEVYGIVKNEELPILSRVLLTAFFQYGVAGLGITVVSILRKESFLSYGLKTEGMFLSILFAVLCFVPNILFSYIFGEINSYLPFQSVLTTKEVLAGDFPINVIGIFITATVWGFFEGFNYVVISEKINRRYPAKFKWLNWGAILCAIMCIFIHGAIGVTFEGILEMITILIIIYGMLMVKEITGNAWGCVFVFVFLWNAF